MGEMQGGNGTNDDTGEALPVFSWRNRQRVLSRGIRPIHEMLSDDGHQRLECACITGVTGKRKQDAILCKIVYDREYVVEYFARHLGPILEGTNVSDFRKLSTEAKKRWGEIESQ